MTRFSKTVLLMGFSLIALNACSSDKGPGPIGTKDDIVVRNNGLPGVQPQSVASAGESVEPASPAVEAAAQAMEANNAPLASATTEPTSETATAELPIDSVAPQDPVRDQQVAVPSQAEIMPAEPAPAVTSAPVPAPSPSSVYPASDYPAQPAAPAVEPAPAPTPAPAPVSSSVPTAPAIPHSAVVPRPAVAAAAPVPAPAPSSSRPYPLDPDAPYSPAAVAAAQGNTAQSEQASQPVTAVFAAKSALKEKGVYSGPVDSTMDAAFLNALTLYQGQNKLPQGGLNAETLQHLGINK